MKQQPPTKKEDTDYFVSPAGVLRDFRSPQHQVRYSVEDHLISNAYR